MRVIILWIFYQLCSFLQLYFSYFGTEFFKESMFIEIYIYIHPLGKRFDIEWQKIFE